MADETPGRVAATLAAIRASTRFGTIAYADNHTCPDVANSCSAHHALRLLAAVEAALKLHRRREESVKTRHVCSVHAYLHHPSPQWRADVDACPDCTVTEKYVCATCRAECPDDDEWPCATYLAITAALTGTQPSEDEGHG